MGHATVDADVLARDETRLVGTEIEHHVGNVQRIADTTDGLLTASGFDLRSSRLPLGRVDASITLLSLTRSPS